MAHVIVPLPFNINNSQWIVICENSILSMNCKNKYFKLTLVFVSCLEISNLRLKRSYLNQGQQISECARTIVYVVFFISEPSRFFHSTTDHHKVKLTYISQEMRSIKKTLNNTRKKYKKQFVTNAQKRKVQVSWDQEK